MPQKTAFVFAIGYAIEPEEFFIRYAALFIKYRKIHVFERPLRQLKPGNGQVIPGAGITIIVITKTGTGAGIAFQAIAYTKRRPGEPGEVRKRIADLNKVDTIRLSLYSR